MDSKKWFFIENILFNRTKKCSPTLLLPCFNTLITKTSRAQGVLFPVTLTNNFIESTCFFKMCDLRSLRRRFSARVFINGYVFVWTGHQTAYRDLDVWCWLSPLKSLLSHMSCLIKFFLGSVILSRLSTQLNSVSVASKSSYNVHMCAEV